MLRNLNTRMLTLNLVFAAFYNVVVILVINRWERDVLIYLSVLGLIQMLHFIILVICFIIFLLKHKPVKAFFYIFSVVLSVNCVGWVAISYLI